MRSADRLLALALAGGALALLVPARPAHAYCRTSVCADPMPAHTAQVCNPAQTSDCGTTLVWPQPCVEWSLQQNASKEVTLAQIQTAMSAAFAAWMEAPCPGGGHPDIKVTQGPDVSCDLHEYNQTKGNANIILFHDDAWPYEGSPNTLALTTVTYNLDNGQIYDADMELNSADNKFTLGDTGVEFDLLSIVTHESGHFLGMAHSPNLDATMFAAYMQGSVNKRHLTADDIAGICAIYPPGTDACACDPTPRHGFSSVCGAEQTGLGDYLVPCVHPAAGTPPLCESAEPGAGGGGGSGPCGGTGTTSTTSGCCSVAPGSAPSGGAGAGALTALAALAAVASARRARASTKRRGG